ncbi:MAG: hypothetical protein HC933_15015 [Pleurocapsa sp. SU_196_0]|nr:hypothetical protein [Pleurocapsa sp. SU_196_0]
MPFVTTARLSIPEAALSRIAALPAFQALNVIIDRDRVIGNAEGNQAAVWFPDQTGATLFYAIVDGTQVKVLLSLKPNDTGVDAVNVLDGRGFTIADLVGVLDPDGQVSDSVTGYDFVAKIARLVVSNPAYAELPRIVGAAPSSATLRTMGGGIPPDTLIELSCVPCRGKAGILLTDATLFVAQLASGGAIIGTAVRAGFLKALFNGGVRQALAILFKSVKGLDVVIQVAGTVRGYDSLITSANDYYSCIQAQCPPALAVSVASLNLSGAPGQTVVSVFTIRAASASGFTFTLSATQGAAIDSIVRVPVRQVRLTPELPGVLFGNQSRSVQYEVTCPATPATLNAEITVGWQASAEDPGHPALLRSRGRSARRRTRAPRVRTDHRGEPNHRQQG